MKKYKVLIEEAIKEVDFKYFYRDERDFSYELYHKLRLKNITGIEFTAETPKQGFFIPDELLENNFFKNHFYHQQNFSLATNKYKRTPDLLFHEYETRSNQLMAIEIKPLKKSISFILTDISKLMFYAKSKLNYKSCILILYSEKENVNKIKKIRSSFNKPLKTFPEIEIWIVYPQRVCVIWSNGRDFDSFNY